MRAMMKAERTISYSATQTTTRAGAPTVVARIQKRGLKKRLEYSAPAIMKGDLLIDDGANSWRYHRAEKSAIKTKTAARRNGANWEAMSRRITVKTQEGSTLSGRKVWIVKATARDKKRGVRKVWIDATTKARLKVERFDAKGKQIETVALSNIKFQKVADWAFVWKSPKGIEVANAGTLYQRINQAKRATAWLQIPTKLPKGYAFENAVVNSDDAWLRYSNGARRFSIFQQRTKDTSSKAIKAAGSGWYWQKGGNRFIIAGLPQAEAKMVASSVR